MKDLSHLMGDTGAALLGGSSSSAGNTINDPVTTVGPASGSEPVNPVPTGPNSKTDAPALEVPSSTKHEGAKSSNSVTSSDAIWKKAGE